MTNGITTNSTQQQLPPDPEGMNGDRAKWAAVALATFMAETGTDDEDALGDLLADLMHWSDRNNYDFDDALDRARCHYEAETGGQEAGDDEYQRSVTIDFECERERKASAEMLIAIRAFIEADKMAEECREWKWENLHHALALARAAIAAAGEEVANAPGRAS